MNSPAGALSRIILAISLCVCVQAVTAQVVPVAGSRVDSTSRPRHDSLRTRDTLRTPVVPIPRIGSIDRTLSVEQTVDDSTINFMDYRSLGDVLTMMPGVLLQELGSAGQMDRLTIQGLPGISFMSNGVPLNEPLTELYDMNLYSLENVDRIEVIQGTRAFLYGLNSTGGTMNIVDKSRKAIHPYTRIHYDQSANNYSLLDGTFSQDIFRGFNLTAGIAHPSFGGRFPNSDEDAWSGRINLRYNLSNEVDIFASDRYNQTHLGLNGGISPTTPKTLRFNEQLDTVLNTDSYEKTTRNDIQAGAAMKLLNDSTAVTTLTLYHSTSLREYRDEENRPDPNGIFVHQDHRSQWYGAKLTHQMSIRNFPLDIGAEYQSRRIIADDVIGQHVSTSLSAFGKIGLNLSPSFDLTPSSRIDNYLHQTDLSYGGDARFHPSTS